VFHFLLEATGHVDYYEKEQSADSAREAHDVPAPPRVAQHGPAAHEEFAIAGGLLVRLLLAPAGKFRG